MAPFLTALLNCIAERHFVEDFGVQCVKGLACNEIFLLALMNDTCFGFIIHMCLILVQPIITKYQICAVTKFCDHAC